MSEITLLLKIDALQLKVFTLTDKSIILDTTGILKILEILAETFFNLKESGNKKKLFL